MYQYVLVHTDMYQLGILVLACTVLYWYVLVRTSTYHFAKSCPGVQDSRCSESSHLKEHVRYGDGRRMAASAGPEPPLPADRAAGVRTVRVISLADLRVSPNLKLS